jgi:cell division protein FtsL
MKIPEIKSPKTFIVIVMVCVFLFLSLLSGAMIDLKNWTFVPRGQNKEIQNLNNRISGLQKDIDDLKKTTVSREEYNRLIDEIRNLNDTAKKLGLLSNEFQPDKPEQVCEAIGQVLDVIRGTKPEIDFLINAVDNEISKKGIIVVNDPRTPRVCIYHIQKVLNVLGYDLNDNANTTYQAVLKFQEDNNLKKDGKIGGKTWSLVRKLWLDKSV